MKGQVVTACYRHSVTDAQHLYMTQCSYDLAVHSYAISVAQLDPSQVVSSKRFKLQHNQYNISSPQASLLLQVKILSFYLQLSFGYICILISP